jgi:hypothetical protein
MGDDERSAVPIVKDTHPKAWAEFGDEFEKKVVLNLVLEQSVLLPNPGEMCLSERRAIAFLRGDLHETFAHQVNLKTSKHVSDLMMPAGSPIELRRTFADLIKVERTSGSPVFQVIDIKATRRATHFHKTQVAFYVRVLEAVLRSLGIKGELHDQGSIWRILSDSASEDGRWEEEPFALAPYLRLVDEFCSKDLPRIANMRVEPSRDETSFHIYFKCEQCEYLSHCRETISLQRKAKNRDVSAVAGISHEAKRSLATIGVRTVGQLASAHGLRQAQHVSWSLRRQADRLVSRASALVENQILPLPNAFTYLMPPRVDVALYVLADHDPVDDDLVTLGYLYDDGSDLRFSVEVLSRASRKDEAEVLFRIFSQILADLEVIDKHNENAELLPEEQIFAHIFLYEATEALNLQSAIARHMDDHRVRAGLLNMVRLFPPDDIVPEPEFRGIHHLPATSLRNVIEQIYALPVHVSYDLRQVSTAFAQINGLSDSYSPTEIFERPFSSLLSIDVIRRLREGRSENPSLEDIKSDVRARLLATRNIAKWLIEENRQTVANGDPSILRLNKSPFRFQSTFDPLDAEDLDILQAYELLESRSGLLEALVKLALPSVQRRDRGYCMAGLTLLKSWESASQRSLLFEVPIESRESDFSSSTFGLILTNDDPDIRFNHGIWPEVACRIAANNENYSANQVLVRMYKRDFESSTFQNLYRNTEDGSWFIDQTFVDINSKRTVDFLRYLSVGAVP